MWILYVVALGFELAGLRMAWRGFKLTWSEYGPEGATYGTEVIPLRRWAAGGWAWVVSWVRRLLRLSQSVTVDAIPAEGAAFGTAEFRASGTVGFAPLPSVADDPEAFAAEVDRRIRAVHLKAQEVEESVSEETSAREKADTDLRADLDARTEEIEHLSKSIAVEGLIMQGRGWVLVFFGVALGGIGNVVQALG